VTETVITVQGEHTRRYAAERARVHAGVHAWGPAREDAFARAVASADAITALTEPLVDEATGAIRSWSKETVRVWSERPWSNDGQQLDPVYHAALDITALFADVDALARWVEHVAVIDEAQVTSLDWELTDETRLAALVDVRREAVADAVAKATSYAGAIGLTTVTPAAIADPGMLGDGSGAGGGPAPVAYRAASMKMADGAGPQLSFRPDEITLTAAIDARFIAR
jgi:uncharacterized protein YggE